MLLLVLPPGPPCQWQSREAIIFDRKLHVVKLDFSIFCVGGTNIAVFLISAPFSSTVFFMSLSFLFSLSSFLSLPNVRDYFPSLRRGERERISAPLVFEAIKEKNQRLPVFSLPKKDTTYPLKTTHVHSIDQSRSPGRIAGCIEIFNPHPRSDSLPRFENRLTRQQNKRFVMSYKIKYFFSQQRRRNAKRTRRVPSALFRSLTPACFDRL